jgi:hypothetical protein
MIYDPTPRWLKMADAVSQFWNVAWPFWEHRTTTANESISGRCYREKRWFRYVVDGIFFWQVDPRHCERAYLADLDRARKTLDATETQDHANDGTKIQV